MVRILCILFCLLGLFTGCASQLVVLQPNCSEMNWFEKGRQDGMQGQPSNNWIMHNKECDKMQQAEIQNYLDGWNRGLSVFCTEQHGYITARTGGSYKKTCPEKYEDDFLRGYQQGLQLFMIEKETAQISDQIDTLQAKLKNNGTSESDKQKIKKDMDDLSQKRVGNLKTLEKYNNSFSR